MTTPTRPPPPPFEIRHACGGLVRRLAGGDAVPSTDLLRRMDVEVLVCTSCNARLERVWQRFHVPETTTRDGRLVPARYGWQRLPRTEATP